MEGSAALEGATPPRKQLESAVVRFAGDSGDGMQLTGSRFTLATALAGNNLATFPDFPAEIRAPAGTTYGVSAFQINFGVHKIKTAGDTVDVLIAMNPAALKVNLGDVHANGLLLVDSGAFGEKNLRKAGYDRDPLEDGSLKGFRVIKIDMSQLTLDALKDSGLSKKDSLRCKNMWALGLIYWIFDRDRQSTVDWLNSKFAKTPEIAAGTLAALNAGHAFGETAEISSDIGAFTVPPAAIGAGVYHNVTGTEAIAWGLAAGAMLAELKMVFCSYPITPASGILHVLARLKEYGVVTFQAEDEIAAVCAAIGASYAGSLGVTSSSGPGIALKAEGIGLAAATELPLVVINSQRAGPSTGMPTKTEQSDLYQAVFGRNADCPLVVLAASSPADCFETAIEAVRLATKYMTPVMLLSDGYIANASEPWALPDTDAFARFPVQFRKDPEGYHPFLRDPETLARPWAVPGTPGLEHRLGGLERDYDTGNVSYDPANHQRMTDARADKIAGVAREIPAQPVELGNDHGPIAVVGWGSTYGPINLAVEHLRDQGIDAAHIHLRHIWPLPANLGDLLRRYERVLVPELNKGQLITLLRSEYLIPAKGLNKVTGKPFAIAEVEDAVRAWLEA